MSKAKTKQEEALQFLDDLDNLSPVPPSSGGSSSAPAPANPGDAADVLKFIDEITLKSSEPTRTTPVPPERPLSRAGTPTLRKATERVRVGSPAPHVAISAAKSEAATPVASAQTRSETPVMSDAGAGKGWGGWGSVWNAASAAVQQARSVVDEGVKNLPNNEQAKKWREGVMTYVPVNKEQLEKFSKDFRTVGITTLTDILNAVAPPIAEHEVIQVWLSHDMEGYEGVESLVYKGLTRIMQQVEGGDLVVNKGYESKPREKGASFERNMNPVDGMDAAFKLAEADIQELIKSNPKKESQSTASIQNPTSYSSVYLRVQPYYSSLPVPGLAISPKAPEKQTHLQFLLYLSDPGHELVHSTITQAIPITWLDHWDKQDWVEDAVVDALRTGVETIGQEYIASRMSWLKEELVAAPEEKEIEAKS